MLYYHHQMRRRIIYPFQGRDGAKPKESKGRSLYNNRGWAYYQLGQLEMATKDYDEAIRFIGEARPRAAILTHLGMSVWRGGPDKFAEMATAATGVRVLAAHDGLVFHLSEMD